MGEDNDDEKKDKKEATDKSEEHLMVAVRIRPLKNEEIQKGVYRITKVVDEKMVILKEPVTEKSDHLRQNRQKDKEYVYDRAFGEDSTQDDVYDQTTKNLVDDVLEGKNATVFAYGATGSGKTFTMVGTTEHPGIMVRALNYLFTEKEQSEDKKFEISMSYLEIYNENIRDLLFPSKNTLELRENAKTGFIQVANLREVSTTNTEEVMRLLTRGNKERTCEPTAANKTSSRSHALLQVNVRYEKITDEGEKEARNGRLYMIDLAGCERAKKTQNHGKRLQEGAHINRSLLALGNCINALAEGKAKYVNFRDSKLTRLLKDALSGNCRTVMIAHVSPAHKHREETRNTLIYADRAKNISNKVKSNVLDVSYHVSQYQTIISELKDEISRLKTKLNSEDIHSEKPLSEMSLEEAEAHQKKAENLKELKRQLLELFREQMNLRSKLMDIDNNVLALSMEFERQNLVVTEWETEKARRKGRQESDKKDGVDGEHVIDMDTDKEKEDSDDDEPEEVVQAWEDLMYLQKEQQRYTEMRNIVEEEMIDTKTKAKELEEALPEKITSEEQRELISLMCKVHELEIQKVEMESEALLKEHELRRRDLLILRYDRQRTLSEEIITRQRQILESMQYGEIAGNQSTMPPELQELYSLYQIEVQYANQDRDLKYINDLNNHMHRSPSMISLRAPSMDRLPPINREPEKLFDKPVRRHSFGDERRPQSVLSIRSPTSSASSVPETRVLQLPPIRGAVLIQSPDFEADEMKHGLKSINHLAANRKREVRKTPNLGHTSLEELTDQEFQLPPSHLRRRSVSCMEDINISLVQGDSPAWLKPKISQRSRRDNHFPQQVPRSPYNRSPSSSDTESPPARQPRYYRRGKGGLKPQRKRGNSLSRLQEKPTGKNTSSWTSGSSRKNSNKYHTVNQKVQQIRTVDNDIPISYGFSLQH